MKTFTSWGVYAIVDSHVHQDYGLERLLKDIVTNSAIPVVQLRLKKYSTREKIDLIKIAHKLKEQRSFCLIVNDDIDLLAEAHELTHIIDGLHLGQKDTAFSLARTQFPDHIMGLSTHSQDQAAYAQTLHADYIGCGSIFPSPSKKDTRLLSSDGLREIVRRVKIPKVAIGGINLDNISAVSASGCDMAAVLSGLTTQGRFIGNKLHEKFCGQQEKKNTPPRRS